MSQVDFPELPTIIERLELARIDYLYGEGGKKPQRNTMILARKYDLKTEQIARQATSWLAELRANAQCASLTYGRATSPEIVDAYEGDVAWIREQIDLLQEKMDRITDEGKGMEAYEFYLRQVLKLQKRWSELAGVESALKLANIVKLTIAREEAKAAIEGELGRNPVQPDGERVIEGHIFNMEEDEEKNSLAPVG